MTIHQAMILAAGKGTRMRPLTLSTPKPLIMAGGKPLIVWHIERLVQMGITHIVINVGHLGQQIISSIGSMSFGASVKFSDETVFEEPLETAGGIAYALHQKLLADEPFLLVNGDVWTDFVCRPPMLAPNCLAYLYLVTNPSHNHAGDFCLQAGQVFAKTCNQPTLTFSGLSLLSPRLFDGLPQKTALPLAPLLVDAIKQGNVQGEQLNGVWVDVGTLERLAWLNDYLQDCDR